MQSQGVAVSLFAAVALVVAVTADPPSGAALPGTEAVAVDAAGGSWRNHTNNWAVLVSTSRFWFNYRHTANVLGVYHSIKRLGIPDSRILLLLADEFACNPRNAYPGRIFNSRDKQLNIYPGTTEVDYRGYEVTAESFVRILTGRHDEAVPRGKRLLSDRNSNVLVYMTGHGGDGFLKFQDAEEISSRDLADAFEQMHQQQRFHELLFIADTCQGQSLHSEIYTPNIIAIGSSRIGENSYAHQTDLEIGVPVIDRFTHATLEYLEHLGASSRRSLHHLFASYDPKRLLSHPAWINRSSRPLDQVMVTDFFGVVQNVRPTTKAYPLDIESDEVVNDQDDDVDQAGIEDHGAAAVLDDLSASGIEIGITSMSATSSTTTMSLYLGMILYLSMMQVLAHWWC